MSNELKQTPLYQNFVDAGAKIVEFGGWAMPVQFSSIKEEHNAVRTEMGVFDVSHMGEILIKGPDAKHLVQYLLSNDTEQLTTTKAQYTALCNESGGIIDDLITYMLEEDKYLLVVNAGNTEKDFEWMKQHATEFDAEVINVSNEYGQLAIQGPYTREFVKAHVDVEVTDMKPFDFKQGVKFFDKNIILSQSGYTGEDGFEIYCKAEDTPYLWEKLLENNIQPCGLGARDRKSVV